MINVSADTVLDVHVHGDEAGWPLLLINPTAQNQLVWTALTPALRDAGYRMICYDHRGIGESPRGRAEISTTGLARDAASLLDALGVQRAHVVGWSLGSAVAQELALARPDRVGSLVLYGTWARADAFQRAVFTSLRHTWATRDMNEIMTAMAVVFSPELINSPALSSLIEQVLPAMPATELQMATTIEQWDADLRHDTHDRLGSITAPTLVIAGEQDLLTPPWQAKAVADAIPGAELEILDGPGSSHALAFERPVEFLSLVLDFLLRNKETLHT
ncbi:alpha/beta fold hydrolase [Acrocarpospora phusangensis]|nr:alpha/beta fold hydrolase [Acrocarpospora phusangensis]